MPGVGQSVLSSVQQDWFGSLASLLLRAGVLQQAGDEVPERVAREVSLSKVKLSGAVSGPGRKAVAEGRFAGRGEAAVRKVDGVVGHVDPLVHKLDRSSQLSPGIKVEEQLVRLLVLPLR